MVKKVDKMVESVRPRHFVEVVPVSRDVHVNYGSQLFLFGDVDDKSMHVRMGDFYEFVSIGLYGGVRDNRYYVKGGKMDRDAVALVKPDIIDVHGRSVREVKANKWTQELNLIDAQMERYLAFMALKPVLTPVLEVYRHRFTGNGDGLKKFRGNDKELFANLADSTAYSLRLPLSLVLALWKFHSISRSRGFTRRYEAKKGTDDEKKRGTKNIYPACTCVSTKTLVELLTDPETIIKILGKNPKEYAIKRLLSPRDFVVGSLPVAQFPVLDIEERHLF